MPHSVTVLVYINWDLVARYIDSESPEGREKGLTGTLYRVFFQSRFNFLASSRSG
jgi:hypothetical protein